MTGTLQRSGCRVDAWFQCSLESAGVSQPVPLYVAMQADMVFVVWFVGFYSALLLFGPCVDFDLLCIASWEDAASGGTYTRCRMSTNICQHPGHCSAHCSDYS